VGLRGVVVTVVVLAAVGGGAYLADNAVRGDAERRVASTISAELGLVTPPTISLGGTPFSLALLTREVPDASAQAASVPVTMAGKEVRLTDVRATAGPITLTGDEVVLDAAAGSATLGYDDLTELAGIDIGWGGDGRLQATYTTEVLGTSVELTVAAAGELDAATQELRLVDPRASVADIELPQSVLVELVDRVVNPISLRLPDDYRLTGLEAGPDGLRLALATDSLTIPLQG
jgi:hypothetical protein